MDGTYRAFFDGRAAKAFLARPDFLVFGLAADEEELGPLVDELLTGLTARAALAPSSAGPEGRN